MLVVIEPNGNVALSYYIYISFYSFGTCLKPVHSICKYMWDCNGRMHTYQLAVSRLMLMAVDPPRGPTPAPDSSVLALTKQT